MSEDKILSIEEVKDDLQSLRKWISGEKYVPNKVDDKILYLIHHSCYYDLDKTKDTIKVYFSMRNKIPEFFADRDVNRKNLQTALESVYVNTFPARDPHGYRILFHSLRLYEPSKYFFSDSVKLIYMTIDACNHLDGALPGYIIMFDMVGVKLGHIARVNLLLLHKFFQYVQEGLPVRLKAIHIVNVIPVIDKIMLLIKPFMKKELYSMIHFHKTADNYDALYEHLPRECLPSDFGGQLASLNELQEQNIERLRALVPFFKEDENMRLNKSKAMDEPPEPVTLDALELD
ncbi:alpha-tocopherol transfer protein-like [Schistocerca americana]|uniref:alpha-tocopherol transfer protein-like n=1 Tax=Schistocerca americana TaxID=7009 RepID=UPI001F4F4858|nr:alpha-tocopherol transfer protein-like [Schistocerca americana]XP_046979459.1 alpha-tocopherol transfer protein-like [Schistocerca americana]